MKKANNYRWKHGNSNVKASAHTGQSMYDAKEVVRLMIGYAESEVKKFHKPDVIGMFMDFCQSMECEGIHNQSLGIKEGVEKYLKSINFL